MKFRDECGCNYVFDFVCYESSKRVYDSQVEKDFDNMLQYVVDWLELEYITHREAYRITEEQAAYLRGASAGFCFAANRRLSGGYCFATLHVLC